MRLTLWSVGMALLGLALRKAWTAAQRYGRQHDPCIHTLIAKNKARYKHEGFDPELRDRAKNKRQRHEAARLKANRIAVTPLPDVLPEPVRVALAFERKASR